MLLVIFGAGASFDSVPHLAPDGDSFKPISYASPRTIQDRHRPPLASQLFENRPEFVQAMEAFPDCKAIVPLLRGTLPVEQQLAVLEQQAESYPARRRQLVAIRLYLHTVLWHCTQNWRTQHKSITNYATLLDAIERWRYGNNEKVCVVTFNYDAMIEQAMEQVLRLGFEHFGRYVSHPMYQLIKLHGSIDWGLELESPQVARSSQELLEHALELRVSDHFRKAALGVTFDDGTVGMPALAIPVQKKNEFMCPPGHLEALATLLPSVTKIIAIGWRATEHHFLNMLKNKLSGLKGDVDLMVVSGDHKGMVETTNNLAIGPPNTTRKRALRDTGFTGLINEIGHLESFLR